MFLKKTALMGAMLVLALCAAAAVPATAHEYKVGDLVIEHPWARPSHGKTGNSAAFMTIADHGKKGDVLLAAKGTVAKKIELHTHIMEKGVMRMRPVKNIKVPAGGKAELKPGSFHVMLIGLTRKLAPGDTFPLTLVFKKAGKVKIDVKVEKGDAGGHMHMDMKHE